jgi:hypothetical protein
MSCLHRGVNPEPSTLASRYTGCAIQNCTLQCSCCIWSRELCATWKLWAPDGWQEAWNILSIHRSLVVSSPLCDLVMVEMKCINVRRNTSVFSNCWGNQLHVSAFFWVAHHHVETRISEKTHILQCWHCKTRSRSPIRDIHIVVYEFSPIFWSQPDDGRPRKGPKYVVDFFNNLKIQLCYDGHLYT